MFYRKTPKPGVFHSDLYACQSRQMGVSMKNKSIQTFVAILVLLFGLAGCGNNKNNDSLLTLCELPKSHEQEIENQIPQWVSDADSLLPMYVMTSTDLEDFDNYAKDIFPTFHDDGWTKEQSDSVYLGQGMEIYHLDGSDREFRIVYYPIILNGVIVSVLDVYEDSNHKMNWQAGPQVVNQFNALIQQTALYNAETALLLGYNNNNLIGIIGSDNGSDTGIVWNNCYILDIDHVDHKEVDTKIIPIKEVSKGTIINVMEPLCVERAVSLD